MGAADRMRLSPDPANLQVRRPGFSYGYVLFRQRRDESIKRGYFQVRGPS